MSNFTEIINDNYLYVDKTKYIEVLESMPRYLVLLRPRRFGKSLFCNMLASYYDMNKKEEFNKLFRDLYIGKKPTELKNGYIVLSLSFSSLKVESDINLLEKDFNITLRNQITDQLEKYKDLFNISLIKEEIAKLNNPARILETVLGHVKRTENKLYLIIDEYDNFTNNIIASNEEEKYKSIVKAGGFLRAFYAEIKKGTESVIDRVFITGVSPVTLDDLTSGANMFYNISLEFGINEMLGFTEEEMNNLLNVLKIDQYTKDKNQLIKDLKSYYNGYKFSKEAKERVYNSDMALYFLNKFIYNRGQYPEELLDHNVRTDYGRLKLLVENNEERLLDIISSKSITTNIITQFSFDNMYDPEYFESFLYYLGLLTIDKAESGRLVELKIPNYVIETLYWEYLRKLIENKYEVKLLTAELRESIKEMLNKGTIEKYAKHIESQFQELSRRDLIKMDERLVKWMIMMGLSYVTGYQVESEKEVEGGYIDIFLNSKDKYVWAIELKYLKAEKEKRLEEIKKEGRIQLNKYMESKKLKKIYGERLRSALLIFTGERKVYLA